MPLFGKSLAYGPLSATSYGYVPPPEATAHGWSCSGDDCRTGEWEPVPRWPMACPRCGAPADPVFDEPWAHEATGPRLRHEIARGGDPFLVSVSQAQLAAWQYKDAMLRDDRAAALAALHVAAGAARAQAENYPDRSGPSSVLVPVVDTALKYGELETAAQALEFWRGLQVTEDIGGSSTHRSSCMNLLSKLADFLADPRTAKHPAVPRFRGYIVELASASREVMAHNVQQKINAVLG
jgi:hypothetical protein